MQTLGFGGAQLNIVDFSDIGNSSILYTSTTSQLWTLELFTLVPGVHYSTRESGSSSLGENLINSPLGNVSP